ncbi:MAG: hypothetical protein KBA75_00235 [Alphaproteobacteria bacterium]|nr:hypothetical protein [Alphaproteobacteria bacterium]
MSTSGIVSRFYGADTYVWDQNFDGLNRLVHDHNQKAPQTLGDIGRGIACAIDQQLVTGRFNHVATTLHKLEKIQDSLKTTPDTPSLAQAFPVVLAAYMQNQLEEVGAVNGARATKRANFFKTLRILRDHPDLLKKTQQHLASQKTYLGFALASDTTCQPNPTTASPYAPQVVVTLRQGKILSYFDDTQGQRNTIMRGTPKDIVTAAHDQTQGGSFRQAAVVLCAMFDGLMQLRPQAPTAKEKATVKTNMLRLKELINPPKRKKHADPGYLLKQQFYAKGGRVPRVW